jgi:hypothetical protein
MAKKSAGINLGLSGSELNRLNRASQAAAGVGTFKAKGLGETLGQLAVDEGTELLKEKAEEKEALEQEQKAEQDRLETSLNTKLDEFINNGSNTNEYNFGYDKLQGIRDQILETTDEKERADLIREFNTYIADIKTQTASDIESATGLQGFSMDMSKNKSNISGATDQRTVSLLEKFYAGESEIFKDPVTGEKKYRIQLPQKPGAAGPPDIFEGTRAELEEMVIPKASEFDLTIGNMAKAVKDNAGSGGFFDEEDVRRQISNNLDTKDFKALFNDKLESTGRNVLQDIEEDLSNATYNDLLDEDELKQFNIIKEEGEENWYDNISEEDKEFLMRQIQEDESLGRSVLENYFFRFVQQQDTKYSKAREEVAVESATLEGKTANIKGSTQAGGSNRLG